MAGGRGCGGAVWTCARCPRTALCTRHIYFPLAARNARSFRRAPPPPPPPRDRPRESERTRERRAGRRGRGARRPASSKGLWTRQPLTSADRIRTRRDTRRHTRGASPSGACVCVSGVSRREPACGHFRFLQIYNIYDQTCILPKAATTTTTLRRRASSASAALALTLALAFALGRCLSSDGPRGRRGRAAGRLGRRGSFAAAVLPKVEAVDGVGRHARAQLLHRNTCDAGETGA